MKARALYVCLAVGIMVPIVGASAASPPPERDKPASPAPPPALAGSSQATPDAPLPRSPTLAGIGGVMSIRGDAVATGANRSARTLRQDARVFLNDQIETGPKAKLQIKFDDGSVLSQGENSTVVIDEYIYAPGKPSECGMAMRLVKGTCRIITGLITKANPERFKVRTRMATVGIRGCDVAFRTQPDRDDVYVLELAGEKQVVVTAAKDGSPVIDPVTGKELPIDEAKRQVVDVVQGGSMVSVVSGKGIVEQRPIGQDELRGVTAETSYLPPARHDLEQGPASATFIIQPGQDASQPSENSDRPK